MGLHPECQEAAKKKTNFYCSVFLYYYYFINISRLGEKDDSRSTSHRLKLPRVTWPIGSFIQIFEKGGGIYKFVNRLIQHFKVKRCTMLEVAIENSLKKTVKYKMHTGHCSKGMDSK